VVSISGNGLNPSPQTHTCSSAGSESFELTLAQNVSLVSPNNLTISSVDQYGNPAGTTTQVNVAIDTRAPTIAITNEGAIVAGLTARFTITITDDHLANLNYNFTISEGVANPASCSLNPCIVEVSLATAGLLTLSVAAGAVADDAGNVTASGASSSLNVMAAGELAINEPLPNITSQNAASYPISGACDSALGDVEVRIGDPLVTEYIPCIGGGYFSDTLDLTGVTSSPITLEVEQGLTVLTASSAPLNDQTPIANAPVVADYSPTSGSGTTISIICNEVGEVVTFSNTYLSPNPQRHTCSTAASEDVNLIFASNSESPNPNNIVVSSTDALGNPTINNSSFNLPIDNIAPVVAITSGAGIIQGNSASFTITITDAHIQAYSFTPLPSSGTVTSGACSSSPCSVTVAGANAGQLTLSVAAGIVSDDAGNQNLAASSSLNITATTLALSNGPVASSLNAASYPVNGICDNGMGDVTVTAGTPDVSETVQCIGGTFSANINVTSVTSNPMSVEAFQNNNVAMMVNFPVNDQTGPASAPVAVAPVGPVNGSSYNLAINCNEVGEVVSISGSGLSPSPQTHTCASAGQEDFELNLTQGVSFVSPHNLTINSTDQYGNAAGATTQVDVAIDTLAPTVAVSASGNIVEGQNASFTINVTDDHLNNLSYIFSVNSGSASPASCSTNPCSVTIIGAEEGTLTLTVAANAVADDAGNLGDSVLRSASLTVGAAVPLVINEPLANINTINSHNYPVSGTCEPALGDVTVTVSSPDAEETFTCNAPGTFSGTMDVSTVTSSPVTVVVSQGPNTSVPSLNPSNDQTPIASAPEIQPQGAGNGNSADISVPCNEIGEVITFSNANLNPNPQTHTCSTAGAENVTLDFSNNVEAFPNIIQVTSTDAAGNPSLQGTSFDLPFDNVAPVVAITAGSGITQGDTATFTITATDGNPLTLSFMPTASSGTISSGACTSSPCSVTVVGADSGTLTLSVAQGAVVDWAGNENAAVSANLNVTATTLAIASAPMATSLNAASYPVSGSCDTGKGDVIITAGTPNVSQTVPCTGSPGAFSATLNVSTVTANPMSLIATQNNNLVVRDPAPANDQTGPASAPVATAPTGTVAGTSYNLAIVCSEAGEVVSISGSGLNPSPQTHTCTNAGSENFALALQQGVSFVSPNNLTISSTDQYGNAAGATTQVNVPIDTLGPSVAISNGGNIFSTQIAHFTITVSDDHINNLSYSFHVNAGTASPTSCSANPCNISVSGAPVGNLTLTVSAATVADDLNNVGPVAAVTSTLEVIYDAPPSIITAHIADDSGNASHWHKLADLVTIEVEFSEAVTVNTVGGLPTIAVSLDTGTKIASYASGSGSSKLRFSFTVGATDEQCNGNVGLNILSLNGGTIRDSIGQNLSGNTLPAIIPNVFVDGQVPVIGSMSTSGTPVNDRALDQSVTATWTRSDNCGVIARTEIAIGRHDGTTCVNPTSTLNYVNIGNVLTSKPVAGTAPFTGTNSFDLDTPQNYCTTVRVTDTAGNMTIRSSGAWTMWYPNAISGMVAWYDLNDKATLKTDSGCLNSASTSQSVNCILDKSTYGNHLNVLVGTSPVYNSSVYGVVFNSGTLKTAPHTSLSFTDTGGMTYFVVAKKTAAGQSAPLSTRDGDNGHVLYCMETSLQYWTKSIPAANNWNQIEAGNYCTTNSQFIAMESLGLGSFRVTRNNNLNEVNRTTMSSYYNSTNRVTIGGRGDDSFRWTGQIQEVIYYNRGLNVTERNTVYSYLRAKWQQ
jgi:acyl dehydratase